MAKEVLIINRGMGNFIGGGENFDLRVSRAFVDMQVKVSIITGVGENQNSIAAGYPDVNFIFLKAPYFRKIEIPVWAPGIVRRAVNFLTLELDLLVFEILALFRVLNHNKVDLVVAGGMVRLGAFLSLAQRRVINRLPGPVSPLVWLLNMNWIYFFGRAAIVANGDAYKQSRWIRRLKFLDIGYPPARFVDETQSRDERDIDVLWVGRLETIKGADRLVGVVQSLNKYDKSLNVTIAGGGSMLPMISKQLASSANISVLGEISSNTVQELFSRSKYLLMLSRYDNWPNVIFEALSQGCNVFAPPVGGIPTIAGRFIGVNLIQDPDNSECVAEFITSVDLVAPKKVIEQYKAVARTWDQVAAEILNICGVNAGTSDLPTSTVEPT